MSRTESRLRLDEVVPLVYDQLKAYASRALDRESEGLSIQTTDLVHEVYLRLSRIREIEWEDDGEILRAAVAVMRRTLVDHARTKHSLKRSPPGRRVMVDENSLPTHSPNTSAVDLLEIDNALEGLAKIDPRKAELVELRYFGGFTEQQAADALQVSLATVKRDWKLAKAWLFRELSYGLPDESTPG